MFSLINLSLGWYVGTVKNYDKEKDEVGIEKSKKIFNNVAFQEWNVVVCFHYNFLSYSKYR